MPRRGRSSPRVDRNALERDRRQYIEELSSRLGFLLPPPLSKRSLPELLDQATTHVKQLGQRVEMLKQKKQLLEGSDTDDQITGIRDQMMSDSWSPVLTVRDLGSMLEVCVKSGSNKKFMLHQVIQVLVEEAAQVVALSYSNVGDRIFYTINAEAVSPRIGIETSRVHERLKELIF
ncbi:Transcription factor bHLH168 [Vitis vinifera]|uniref:Transcription factor bHLH168 n=1 Tax=Vitis vinifera TaxID=29760 RepID=A0A438EHK8_VITVI|nr:Transcription factor bHLH168 [Vitis vinifera]